MKKAVIIACLVFKMIKHYQPQNHFTKYNINMLMRKQFLVAVRKILIRLHSLSNCKHIVQCYSFVHISWLYLIKFISSNPVQHQFHKALTYSGFLSYPRYYTFQPHSERKRPPPSYLLYCFLCGGKTL